jgi:hypothetical protein
MTRRSMERFRTLKSSIARGVPALVRSGYYVIRAKRCLTLAQRCAKVSSSNAHVTGNDAE